MLKQLPTKYEWVYILEADERMTPDLFNECLQAIQTSEYIGYYVAEQVIFMNRWIEKHNRYSTDEVKKPCTN